VLTTRLEPGTPGSPEESLTTRLFTPDTPSARAQGYNWDGTEESCHQTARSPQPLPEAGGPIDAILKFDSRQHAVVSADMIAGYTPQTRTPLCLTTTALLPCGLEERSDLY